MRIQAMSPPGLSHRANQTVPDLDTPWRFAPKGTYHPTDDPEGLISFATAENTLMEDELEAFASNVRIPKEAYSYRFSTGGGPLFPTVLANHINEVFHPYKDLTGSDIQVVGAATAMHEALGWACADRGEGILVSRPVYGRFELDFGNKIGLHIRYAETAVADCLDADVVDAFEDALSAARADGVQPRALLIVNPSNPLGRCYPRETIVELMRFCGGHGLHFISDEMYASSVHEPNHPHLLPFTSALSIDPAGLIDPEFLHVTYGLGKDFAVPGLRVGAVVTRSQAVHRAVKSIMRFHNPSGASIAIGTAMLQDREWCRRFLKTATTRIAAAYKHVTAGLDAMGIPYLPANAGFFVYIDLSAFLVDKDGIDSEFALAQTLLDHGVFLHPKEEHGPKGWFRLVFTQEASVVTEGLRRMLQALRLEARI